MTTVFDVPAAEMIDKLAGILKENENVVPPQWAGNVKTGVHKDLPPTNDDWWYVRCAAVLRKIYTDGPIGIERLRSVYGGKKDNGSQPYHKAKGSGSIARKSVQQLEAAGFLQKVKDGRTVSAKGRSMMDNAAHELKQELLEKIPELAKY
ncbi:MULTISPECIES: 30S ribosomal protein S19e [Methanosarcina]|jgi:small subunit ribosomal protein S19e|uniref:Small ribosomal subunit protein eS19 n=8 Tax=Methanosarcina mazei TaxID=2209 RepID=A0A0F8IWG4_METMZ|nr:MULTISPECIES: 30S ribosomal protein S19e [Methanosarcina]AAM30498.1 SSU ribosomal protein S19E [Methanosarcina mazei Go1]AGF96229.1 SSU ribosomal protein S19e [Methanosarcina mazei Tuc01]AKB39512.1 SSU ribosomal protein S19e [Methanosarcina mazei WWM610]AKB60483.1 SSU ribosomal protein S19e [Methanosarcina mazei SarPi]AKB63699.1 SSU ribosomal protein S19e [Methanosarcina mazei S-6]